VTAPQRGDVKFLKRSYRYDGRAERESPPILDCQSGRNHSGDRGLVIHRLSNATAATAAVAGGGESVARLVKSGTARQKRRCNDST